MIDITVYVRCDAVVADGLCEAEFQMEDYGTPFNPLRIAHQLQQRGWVTERPDAMSGYRTLCPFHQTADPTPDTETPCPACNGDGESEESPLAPCPVCLGTGVARAATADPTPPPETP